MRVWEAKLAYVRCREFDHIEVFFCNLRLNFVTCWGYFGAFGKNSGSMVALGVPQGSKAPQSQLLVTLWAPFGSPRGALLVWFWQNKSKVEGWCGLFSALFPASEKGTTTDLPRVGGHAIRSRRRRFREGRPLSCWLHFGLHFGAILGAKVGLDSFWAARVGNRPPKEVLS